MEILEFGNIKKKKIILLHGFECPYQIWNDYIEYYKRDFFIIVPILKGHNSKIKEEFISFKDLASDIENYYLNKYGDKVYAIYGISMGGVLALHIFENRKLNIKKLILESSPLVSCNKAITYLLINQYLLLTHKAQKRDKRVIKQATNSIVTEGMVNEFLNVIDNISDNTIINYVKAVCSYNLPINIEAKDTEIYYYYGTKINEILAKKSAKYIKKNYPSSKIMCQIGKGHCEELIFNVQEKIQKLNQILKNG